MSLPSSGRKELGAQNRKSVPAPVSDRLNACRKNAVADPSTRFDLRRTDYQISPRGKFRLRLGGLKKVRRHMFQHSSAIAFVEQRFPEISDELHDETIEGLMHPQIGEFSRYAQAAIDRGDINVWSRVTEVFMELWQDCDDAVRNALNVSFLEHLNFKDGKVQRRWAYNVMPKTMKVAWQEMEQYNKGIHGA